MTSIMQNWRVDVTNLVNCLNREMKSVNEYYPDYESFRDRWKNTDPSAPASLYIPSESYPTTQHLEDRILELESCVSQQAEIIDILQKTFLPIVREDTETNRELMI